MTHGSTYNPIADGSRSRFIRAELELARGDTTVAIGLYRGFDESSSPWDMYHRPIVYQRRGEIAAAQGRPADAIPYNTRLLDLWPRDPALIVNRNEIQLRREVLRISAAQDGNPNPRS